MKRPKIRLILLGALVAGGCGSETSPAAAPSWTDAARGEVEVLEAQLEAAAPAAAGEVRVQLAFGAGADLDLYVTGPLQETVYYANTPSAIGGELGEDKRCGHPEPRVETTRFPAHLPGRYRVGVDYAHGCGQRAPVPFALLIDADGKRVPLRGLAAYQVFEPIVLEFEVKEPE